MLKISQRLVRFCAKERSFSAQFAVDSLISPLAYRVATYAIFPSNLPRVLGGGGAQGDSGERLEALLGPILRPNAPDAVPLPVLERNVRFRSWARLAFLEAKYGSSMRIWDASAKFFDKFPEVPSLAEVNEVFGTGSWERHPKEEEQDLQKRLVKQYETEGPEACKNWSLEQSLEAIGCCVIGMNEFNLFCEHHFVYEFFTKEFIRELFRYIETSCVEIKKKQGLDEVLVLEVGAGTGQLTWLLIQEYNKSRQENNVRIKFLATDTGLWSERHSAGAVNELDIVKNSSFVKALEEFSPNLVLCSWMPMEQDWTEDFRKCPSVEEYVLIGEVDDGCCGHPWKTWGQVIDQGVEHQIFFEENRVHAKNLSERSVDVFHWLGKPRDRKAPANAEIQMKGTDPPYESDGFEKTCLGFGHLQLSRYDRAHFAANSKTVSFRKKRDNL